VIQRKWQRVLDVVSADGKAVYETDGRHRRLVIHELCKMAALPHTIRSSKDEMSDDEDEDHEQQVEDEELGALAQDLSISCQQCEHEENAKICEVARLMIDISHALGPVSVMVPAATSDDEDNNEGEGNGAANGDENGDGQDVNPPQNRSDNSTNDTDGTFRFHESVLTVPDALGKTPLHILCESSCDLNLMKAIFACTRENTGNPCSPTAMSLITARDSKGCSPLHYLAYSRQCPFSSLQLMMDYCKPFYPRCDGGLLMDPTLCTDVDGDTPLHWALDGYMSPRRIKELIRHSKDAMNIKNHMGSLPFDQFAINFIDADWKVHDVCGREVWENIQAYLRVVFDDRLPTDVSNDSDGSSSTGNENKPPAWLPLHLIAGAKCDLPPIFTDIALHYCKDDLSNTNSEGMLPLHLACNRISLDKNCPCDGAMAKKILVEYPQAAYKEVSSTKRLAIHLAVASHKPMSLITSLIKSYPRSLNIPDPVTKLWPFVLAAVENEESIQVSFTLLRADPSILQLALQAQMSKRGQRAKEAQQVMDAAAEFERDRRTFRRMDRPEAIF
jgi:ankyrin repeat protein